MLKGDGDVVSGMKNKLQAADRQRHPGQRSG
jgi:hypothetical protein